MASQPHEAGQLHGQAFCELLLLCTCPSSSVPLTGTIGGITRTCCWRSVSSHAQGRQRAHGVTHTLHVRPTLLMIMPQTNRVSAYIATSCFLSFSSAASAAGLLWEGNTLGKAPRGTQAYLMECPKHPHIPIPCLLALLHVPTPLFASQKGLLTDHAWGQQQVSNR